jgi:putative glutamine amidotransferase
MSASGCSSVARPVVGITTYVTPAKWSYWELEAALVPAEYVWAIERAGGRPLLVPPSAEGVDETLDALDGILFSGGSDLDPELYGQESHPETFGIVKERDRAELALLEPPSDDGIDETLDALDGLVFSGGSDLDPELYGQEAHPETLGVVKERDRAELALLEAALARDMPVLAVCRGSQVLNVALGGDLVQHLPDVVGDEKHKHTPGTFGDHEVEIDPATRLGAIVGDRAPVKSHHHQGFGRLGEGLRESARADDGTVEAIEDPARRFTVGVLWHPEEGDDARLFEELVTQAAAYREERARR